MLASGSTSTTLIETILSDPGNLGISDPMGFKPWQLSEHSKNLENPAFLSQVYPVMTPQ